MGIMGCGNGKYANGNYAQKKSTAFLQLLISTSASCFVLTEEFKGKQFVIEIRVHIN